MNPRGREGISAAGFFLIALFKVTLSNNC